MNMFYKKVTLYHLPKLIGIMVLVIFSVSSEAVEEKPYTIVREGQFDKSSEQLILRFEKLKYGVTLETVKKLFPEPEQVRWEIHSIDRHYAKVICFQWQEDVFFCFSFQNIRPWIKGKPNFPEKNSADWRLECATVVRERTKVVDGERVVEMVFSKPCVTYFYEKVGEIYSTKPMDRIPVE